MQCESDLLHRIDLPSAETLAKFLDRNVDVDYFVGPREEGVRDGFVNRYSDKSFDDVVEALDMLNVKRRDDVDPSFQQRVLVTFGVASAGSV